MAGSIEPYYTPLDTSNFLHGTVVKFLVSPEAINIYKWLPTHSINSLQEVCVQWKEWIRINCSSQWASNIKCANIKHGKQFLGLLFSKRNTFFDCFVLNPHMLTQALAYISTRTSYIKMQDFLDKIDELIAIIAKGDPTIPLKMSLDSFIKLLRAARHIDQEKGNKILNSLKQSINLRQPYLSYFHLRIAEIEMGWGLIEQEKLHQAQQNFQQAIQSERDTLDQSELGKQYDLAWLETAVSIDHARQSILNATQTVEEPERPLSMLLAHISKLEAFGDEEQQKEALLFTEIIKEFSKNREQSIEEVNLEERKKSLLEDVKECPDSIQPFINLATMYLPDDLKGAIQILEQATNLLNQNDFLPLEPKTAKDALERARLIVLVHKLQQSQINFIEKQNSLMSLKESAEYLFANEIDIFSRLDKYILIFIRELIKE